MIDDVTQPDRDPIPLLRRETLEAQAAFIVALDEHAPIPIEGSDLLAWARQHVDAEVVRRFERAMESAVNAPEEMLHAHERRFMEAFAGLIAGEF